MKKLINGLVVFTLSVMFATVAFAQTGSIGGTVVDEAGSVVPGATVVVRGPAGQNYTAVTGSSGGYNVPAVATGIYTVSISSSGFKTLVVENVKVDVGTPTRVDGVLQTGGVEETVVVTTGGEVLQTQTAAVGTTIQGRQILETPIRSRDALDLISLLPGTATVGRPRSASINGLPKGALTITVDGVDAQDNTLRSSDGFFTYVRPRVDAIEEVTVSTSNPGSEVGGDGAVQIRFVTRRGTNDYTGGLFWKHRNEALNSNYWYNNRDRIARQRIILNEFGGRVGGPIPFLGFGNGVKPFDSGKNKRFFFVAWEEFRLPESVTRTRTIFSPAIATGNYSYITQAGVQTVNLFNIAAANAELATIDPTILSILNRIQSAANSIGTTSAITNDPNRRFYNFTNSGLNTRNFFALRLDANITKNHAAEFVVNRQHFRPGMDFLNSRDPIFPGFPFYGQGGIRRSWSYALRSTFGKNVVNELRYAQSGGATDFFGTVSPADFAFSQGFLLDFGVGGVTTPYNNNFAQVRSTPTYDLTNSTTWVTGRHSINFGGQYKIIRTLNTNLNRVVPTVGFGIVNSGNQTTAFGMFNATTMPGSTATQQAEARSIYSLLVGRIISYASNAYLNAEGTYVENGVQIQNFRQKTYGLFAQDNWRIRPNFSVNFGIRWQPQEAFEIRTANVGKLENPDQVWGISGKGNIFRPGATGGQAPRVILYQVGEKAYSDDMNNWAPSVGFVWSPGFKGSVARFMFGEQNQSVFRGGFSRAFVREGSSLQTTITGNTPGGLLSLTRATTVAGSLTLGTNLRDANNPNLVSPSFNPTPNFPLALTAANQALAVDPDIKTGYVNSFSLSYQRQLDRNSVVEVRYVGNRGYGIYRLNFINETNVIENGFAQEFVLAQQNLYANEAAFAAGQTNRRLCPAFVNMSGNCVVSSTDSTPVARVPTFGFFGPGTSTSPLPIILAYFNNYGNPTAYQAAINNPAQYLSATNFGNAALVALLSVNNPNVLGFVGSASFENNATRRANAIANGLPANFFRVNPTVPAGAFQLSDDARTWYDSGTIEYRRRLSDGVRIQSSYVWSKAQSNAFASSGTQQSNYSLRPQGIINAKNVQVFDVRHVFIFDATWDLPFGRGQRFGRNMNRAADLIVGGWSIMPVIRWQSGSPFQFGNVTLVGMTKKELQKEIKVRKGPNVVTFLPDDIILNTQRAFDISITSPTGYGTTFGGPPTGRFIAPAGYGNCISKYAGECGFTNLIMYGPDFFLFDASISKRFRIDEKRNIEFRMTMLDVLNQPPFRVGGWGADVTAAGVGGATFGQLGAGSAYQDLSTTNNPGGRMIDLSFRFNF
ncbi:TonB-dependent receptor [Leptolyngbya sp. 7M]|uniref:TonB-dependent receptor n=1 Tax=Leptolyngbya sp. 7M TaxID=2812896 RepID=UPI001B8DA41D|nr:TonB-dependent receptor [Leptolyngbya sp. 7M]QYO65450.1 TonB-dependent receptor [Leptolyngbya sp. 7M]